VKDIFRIDSARNKPQNPRNEKKRSGSKNTAHSCRTGFLLYVNHSCSLQDHLQFNIYTFTPMFSTSRVGSSSSSSVGVGSRGALAGGRGWGREVRIPRGRSTVPFKHVVVTRCVFELPPTRMLESGCVVLGGTRTRTDSVENDPDCESRALL